MELLITDLDGTLFDTRRVNYMAYKDAVSAYGYTLDYQYYCDYCNGRYYLDFLPQITTSDRDILEGIHKKKKAAYCKYLGNAVLNRHLAELIKLVKPSCHTALVTTASKQNTIDILNKFNLVNLFELILTSEDVKNPKPDPECYQKALDYFRIASKDAIVFEDSCIGLEAAKRADIACFVTEGFNGVSLVKALRSL